MSKVSFDATGLVARRIARVLNVEGASSTIALEIHKNPQGDFVQTVRKLLKERDPKGFALLEKVTQ